MILLEKWETPLFTLSSCQNLPRCQIHSKYALNAGFMTLGTMQKPTQGYAHQNFASGEPPSSPIEGRYSEHRGPHPGWTEQWADTGSLLNTCPRRIWLSNPWPPRVHSWDVFKLPEKTSENTSHQDTKASATQQLAKCQLRSIHAADPETSPHLRNPWNHWGNQVCPSLIYILLYVIEN